MSGSTQQPASAAAAVPEKAIAYFELAVSLYLWRWPALSLAVENEWGGPDSSEKRDWLAGVLADLFTSSKSEVDVEDVEDVAAQVLSDEFSVVLEDDSAYDVATAICGAWKACQEGRFEGIEALKVQFQNAKPVEKKIAKAKDGDESDSSSGTDAEVDDDQPAGEAMEIDEPVRQKPAPIVDDDGFELVQAKGKGKSSRR